MESNAGGRVSEPGVSTTASSSLVDRSEDADRCEHEAALRATLCLFQSFLGEFGFMPTRVVTFLRLLPGMSDFPGRATLREIRECEDRSLYSEATTRFLGDLLSENAPTGAVSALMDALFDANDSPDNPNEGAWRCHDILTVASGFLPSQEVLVGFIDSSEMDIGLVASHLSSHGLLTPDDMEKVMTLPDLEGRRSAAVYMFACLYATYVDSLRGEWLMLPDYPEYTGPPAWLQTLLDTLGRYAGTNMQEELPNLQLSPGFWINIEEQLTFRRSTANSRVDDETGSEAGESVVSDVTVRGDADNTHVKEWDRRDRNVDEGRGYGIQRVSAYILNLHRMSSRLLNVNPFNVELVQHDQVDYRDHLPQAASDDWDERSSVSTATSYEENDKASVLGKQVLAPREPGEITLRAYQEELLTYARDGLSVLIILPTGTGKTYIILKYVQSGLVKSAFKNSCLRFYIKTTCKPAWNPLSKEILSRPGTDRVVFLAPKVRLVEQQCKRFHSYFPDTTYFRCGNSRSCKSPFSQLLDTYRIYVMTPMCLVEAIRAKEVRITDFSVLVLDECHNTQGGHAFANLMDLYMDIKFDNQGPSFSRLPQIIGLTASPGVGKGGNLSTAIAHVKSLCDILDAERICTVKKYEEELRYFINEPIHEVHRCSGRKKDTFRKIVESMMASIENDMASYLERTCKNISYETLKGQLAAPTVSRGQLRYTQWARSLDRDLVDLVPDKDLYTSLFASVEKLLDYQKALVLNEDCESQYALDFLLDTFNEMNSMPQRLTEGDRRLLRQFRENEAELVKASGDKEDSNPKLKMLEDILLNVMEKEGDNVSCMVFVRTIELTKAIHQWIGKHPVLHKLTPGRIIGSKVSSESTGMTKAQIGDVLVKFNNGDHKVVVCTSAAEEGLDFQACSVVVRYTYVTNVVSMIQSRGRARRMNSQYCVLDDLQGGCVRKENENLANEALMQQAVEHVQKIMEDNPNDFRKSMLERQQSQVLARKLAMGATVTKREQAGFSTKVYYLRCRKCREKVFTSYDIRQIGQGSHTLTDDHLRGKWAKTRELPIPQQWTMNMERIAGVCCKSCGHKWGSLARYIPSGNEYPILKLEHFILEDVATGTEISRKMKWSDRLFSVRELTEEEKGKL